MEMGEVKKRFNDILCGLDLGCQPLELPTILEGRSASGRPAACPRP
ncbi:MAG: hypothetical protein MZV70_61420 [Desulfobacterales bacterium]|nr:hypothetical protein [Desulfobacterales bacterium]